MASSTETRTFHHIIEQPVISISMVILLCKGNRLRAKKGPISVSIIEEKYMKIYLRNKETQQTKYNFCVFK